MMVCRPWRQAAQPAAQALRALQQGLCAGVGKTQAQPGLCGVVEAEGGARHGQHLMLQAEVYPRLRRHQWQRAGKPGPDKHAALGLAEFKQPAAMRVQCSGQRTGLDRVSLAQHGQVVIQAAGGQHRGQGQLLKRAAVHIGGLLGQHDGAQHVRGAISMPRRRAGATTLE